MNFKKFDLVYIRDKNNKFIKGYLIEIYNKFFDETIWIVQYRGRLGRFSEKCLFLPLNANDLMKEIL